MKLCDGIFVVIYHSARQIGPDYMTIGDRKQEIGPGHLKL